MGKILFITIPEKGHINPMIGLAHQLRAEGHRVDFWSYYDISEQLSAIGFKSYFAQSQAHRALPSKGLDFVNKLKDEQWLEAWIKSLLIDAAPQMAEALLAFVQEYRPDVLISDPMVYATPIVSHKLGIPWLGVSNSLNPVTPYDWDCALTRTLKKLDKHRAKLMADNGMPQAVFNISDAVSPYGNVVFTSPEYARPGLSSSNLVFAGTPVPEGLPRGDEDSQQTDYPEADVYMSLGSQVYYHPEWFIKVDKALQLLGLKGLFSVNELMDNSDFVGKISANTMLYRYTSQLRLLPRVKLVISHGGANSVVEALTFGIPLVLTPVCNDQFLQLRFVEANGVGKGLNPDTQSPEQIAAVISHILQPKSGFSEKARYFQQTLLDARRPAALLQLINDVCKGR